MTTFNEKIEKYFGERLEWGGVRVLESRRLTGGISRETWRVSLETTAPTGAVESRDIVLRLDPAASVLNSNRPIEFAMLRAFASLPGVPVPAAICSEDDPTHLGASFMAVGALPGVADIAAIVSPAFQQMGPQIARAHFRTLGSMVTLDHREHGLDRLLEAPTPASAASDALAYWEAVLREKSLGPRPITEAAIRHLKHHLPPVPQRIVVSHGDYRLGNCLYLPDGTLSGVLDWEMVHLGDPLEDLAWALHPDWRPSSARDKVAGHLSEEDAIRSWEAGSDLLVDRDALRWWRLFSCVKAAAIATTGGFNFVTTKGTPPFYALVAWLNMDNQEAMMMKWLGVQA